jgi:hypothetical protein
MEARSRAVRATRILDSPSGDQSAPEIIWRDREDLGSLMVETEGLLNPTDTTDNDVSKDTRTENCDEYERANDHKR